MAVQDVEVVTDRARREIERIRDEGGGHASVPFKTRRISCCTDESRTIERSTRSSDA